jgi:hypothetical protein
MDHQRWVPRINIVNQPRQLVMTKQASTLHEEYSNKHYLLNQYWGGKSEKKCVSKYFCIKLTHELQTF